MDTFPATPIPHVQSGMNAKPRELVAQFGEGYEQSSQDGPNPVQRDWALVWSNRTPAEVKTLTDFLEAHVGKRFLWTALPPYDSEGAKVFRCPGGWNLVYSGSKIVGLTLTLSQRPAV